MAADEQARRMAASARRSAERGRVPLASHGQTTHIDQIGRATAERYDDRRQANRTVNGVFRSRDDYRKVAAYAVAANEEAVAAYLERCRSGLAANGWDGDRNDYLDLDVDLADAGVKGAIYARRDEHSLVVDRYDAAKARVVLRYDPDKENGLVVITAYPAQSAGDVLEGPAPEIYRSMSAYVHGSTRDRAIAEYGNSEAGREHPLEMLGFSGSRPDYGVRIDDVDAGCRLTMRFVDPPQCLGLSVTDLVSKRPVSGIRKLGMLASHVPELYVARRAYAPPTAFGEPMPTMAEATKASASVREEMLRKLEQAKGASKQAERDLRPDIDTGSIRGPEESESQLGL